MTINFFPPCNSLLPCMEMEKLLPSPVMWADLGDFLDNRIHRSDALSLLRLSHRKPPSFCLGLLECSLEMLPLQALSKFWEGQVHGKALYRSSSQQPTHSPHRLWWVSHMGCPAQLSLQMAAAPATIWMNATVWKTLSEICSSESNQPLRHER